MVISTSSHLNNEPIIFVWLVSGVPPMNKRAVNADGWFCFGDQKLMVPFGKVELLKEKDYIDKPFSLVRPEDIHNPVCETIPNSRLPVDLVELRFRNQFIFHYNPNSCSKYTNSKN